MSIKKLAKETAWYGVSSIVGRFLNVLLVPMYTHVLPPAEYGVVTDLYATSAFVMVLLTYRMESAFFRFGTDAHHRRRAFSTAFFSLLTSTSAIVLLLLTFAPSIARELKYPEHPEFVRYFALILAFDCLCELPFAQLRLESRPKKFAIAKVFNICINIAMNLFWLIVCPYAAQKGWQWVQWVWSPEGSVRYIFLSNLIASMLTCALLLPEMRLAAVGYFDRSLWQRMVKYAAPLTLSSFAGIIDEMLSRASMKYLLPGSPAENAAELGIFGANYKLAMLIGLVTQAYRYAAEPFFFRSAHQSDALDIQANTTKWYTIVVSAGMLGILCFLDVVKYFIGKDYHAGLKVVPLLLLANIFSGIYYNFSVWYRLKDQTMTGAWISISSAILTLILNLWWVPRFGYIGAAWASLICYVYLSWLTWFTGRKVYPAPYPFDRIIGYMLLALALGLFSRWWVVQFSPDILLNLLLNVLIFSVFIVFIIKLEKIPFRQRDA